jgi:hypothetical protein
MDSTLVAPEDGELQKFVLDPNLSLYTVYTEFWNRIKSTVEKHNSIDCGDKMRLYFRKKKK